MKFSRIKLVERKFVKLPAKFGEVKQRRALENRETVERGSRVEKLIVRERERERDNALQRNFRIFIGE